MIAIAAAIGGLMAVAMFFLTIATVFDRVRALEARVCQLETAEGIEIHGVRK